MCSVCMKLQDSLGVRKGKGRGAKTPQWMPPTPAQRCPEVSREEMRLAGGWEILLVSWKEPEPRSQRPWTEGSTICVLAVGKS